MDGDDETLEHYFMKLKIDINHYFACFQEPSWLEYLDPIDAASMMDCVMRSWLESQAPDDLLSSLAHTFLQDTVESGQDTRQEQDLVTPLMRSVTYPASESYTFVIAPPVPHQSDVPDTSNYDVVHSSSLSTAAPMSQDPTAQLTSTCYTAKSAAVTPSTPCTSTGRASSDADSSNWRVSARKRLTDNPHFTILQDTLRQDCLVNALPAELIALVDDSSTGCQPATRCDPEESGEHTPEDTTDTPLQPGASGPSSSSATPSDHPSSVSHLAAREATLRQKLTLYHPFIPGHVTFLQRHYDDNKSSLDARLQAAVSAGEDKTAVREDHQVRHHLLLDQMDNSLEYMMIKYSIDSRDTPAKRSRKRRRTSPKVKCTPHSSYEPQMQSLAPGHSQHHSPVTPTCHDGGLTRTVPETPSTTHGYPPSHSHSSLGCVAANVLQRWYIANRDFPYPDMDTVKRLAAAGGTTVKQARRWFNNKRSRDKTARWNVK